MAKMTCCDQTEGSLKQMGYCSTLGAGPGSKEQETEVTVHIWLTLSCHVQMVGSSDGFFQQESAPGLSGSQSDKAPLE